MSTVNGLPAHILLVHAIVVLLPLAALLLVLTAVWAPARLRLAGPNALLAVFVLVLVPVTTDAGEWLERRVPRTDLLREHTKVGDTALFIALPLAVLAVLIWWRSREAAAGESRRTFLAPSSSTVTAVLAVVAVLIAGSAVYDTYRIGDSGAKASWDGRVSPTPQPRDQRGPND